MPKWDRSLWLVAQKIVAALADLHQTEVQPMIPRHALTDLFRWESQIAAAQERGWSVAAGIIRQTWRTRLQWFVNDLQRLLLDTQGPPPTPPCAGSVYRDLLALEEEFRQVTVDEKNTSVTVLTDRIVLEDIDLGPFALVWNWSRIGDNGELRVIPQEPHPAKSDDEVAHPHLRREELCVGEAAMPLERAFRSGRVYDALLIVRQVLRTYNDESAYVVLRDWSGTHCEWCDESLTESAAWTCDHCGADLCDDCRHACSRCGNTLCQRCEHICPECEETVCATCRPFDGPRRSALCHPCCHREEEDDEPPKHEPEAETPTAPNGADAAPDILAPGMGEAVVPAGCG